MNYKLSTKIISLLITISMVFSIIGSTAVMAAINTTDEPLENRGKLSMAFLGTGETPSKAAQEIPDTSTWKNKQDDGTGTKFWVGIYLSNLKTMDTDVVAQLGNGLSSLFEASGDGGGTGGIFSFSSGIMYASDLVAPIAEDYGGTESENMDAYLSDNLLSMDIWEPFSSRYSSDGLTAFKVDPLDHPSAETVTVASPKVISWSFSSTNAINRVFRNAGTLSDDPLFLMVMQFELLKAPPAGTTVVSAVRNANQLVFQTGTDGERFGGQWNSDRSITSNENLKNYLDYTGDLELFPAAATDVLDGINVTGGANLSYIEGNVFNPAGITVTPHKLETGNQTAIIPTADDFKGLKFYVDSVGTKDETDLDTTRELTTTEKLTTADNGKYVYVSYTLGNVTKVDCLGQLAVTAKTVTGLTVKTGSTFGTGSYYSTTNILDGFSATPAETLVIVRTYNNGETDEVAYADFASKGLGLYKTDTAGKLVAISANDKYTTGAANTNVFYVAETLNVTAGVTEPNAVAVKAEIKNKNIVTADTMVIDSYVSGAKLKYAADAKVVIPDDLTLSTYTASAGAGSKTNKKVSEIGASNLIFYYGDTTTETYNAGKVITSGVTDYSTVKGKYLLVVPADNTLAAPVSIGQFADRAIDKVNTSSNSVSDLTTTVTYGDKLGNEMKVTVLYDNGETEQIAYADFTAAGITMKIGEDVVTNETVLTPAMSNKKVEFIYDGTKIAQSGALTVNKKEITYVVETATLEKVYDGNTTVEEADVTALGLKIKASDLVTADTALSTTVGVDGLTFTYDTKDVGNNKTIKVAGTAAAKKIGAGTDTNVADFNSKYTLKAGDGFANNGAELTTKGEITAKTIKIISITGVPSIEVGATNLTGTGDLALTTENSEIVSGDSVSLKYKYTYNPADVNVPGEPTVAIMVTGGELGLTGTNAGNYTLDTGNIPVTKGKVLNKNLNAITVKTTPTKVAYTYPDLTLDLSGMEFDLDYDGATGATTIDLDQFFADGGQIKVTNKENEEITLTKDNYLTDTVILPYGESVELSISYGSKTTTQNIKVSRKTINLSTDVTFAPEVPVGSETVTGNAAITAGLEESDTGKVQISAKYEFTDKTIGDNKTVNITEITLTGEAADNYVISANSTTVNNGKVVAGEQTAPETPVIKVDAATNNIIVVSPVDVDNNTYEYSIDGTNWVKETTFTGLDKNKEYTVSVRKAQTETENPSPASSAKATTFKNFVQIYKSKSDTLLASAYVNDITGITDKSDFNTKVGVSPSRCKAYFTDKEANTAVVYPLNITGDTTLYMTQTSSGGGGGSSGSSTSIKFEQASYEGAVGDKIKIDATITGSTSKPKWTSSNEKIAIVDENGNVTCISEGKATIKVNVDGTVKSTTVTVTKAEATPVPTVKPTEEPSDEPVINEYYTEPYASGYDDGSFMPQNNITRAELATMIARLSNGSDITDGAYVASFPDVSADAWYNKYIGYLEGLNVISGYEDGTFRPNDTITRGEISAVIARAQRYDLIPYDGMFGDVLDTDWAKDYIETLATKNIVSGYEDGTFGPYSPLTRAEAVAIINRVLAPSTSIVEFTPNDIAGHWAEADIMLAVNERKINGEAIPAPGPVVTPEATVVPEETVAPETTTNPEETAAPEATATPEA